MIIIRVWLVLFALLLGNMGWKCVGQDLPKVAPASVSFQARVERVEDNWEDLVGVAIRPGGTGERYEVFVLDGATGNLVRFYSDEPAKRANVITGIQLTESGSGEDRPPGGWAMAFLNRSHLLVMGGSLDGTQHVLKSFELPIDGQSMAAGEPHQEILSTPHRQPLGEGERSLFGIALDSERVYLCREGSQFAVAEASLQGNRLGDIGVWATAQPGDKPSGAACVTVNPRRDKSYVVVGIPAKSPQQSRLEFYHPGTAQRLLSLEIPLLEVAGLAYGPDSGLLYAIDAARTDPARGGIYRLDARLDGGRQACAAHLVAPLVRPRAMAFGPDGMLYVIAGNQVEDELSGRSGLYRVADPL